MNKLNQIKNVMLVRDGRVFCQQRDCEFSMEIGATFEYLRKGLNKHMNTVHKKKLSEKSIWFKVEDNGILKEINVEEFKKWLDCRPKSSIGEFCGQLEEKGSEELRGLASSFLSTASTERKALLDTLLQRTIKEGILDGFWGEPKELAKQLLIISERASGIHLKDHLEPIVKKLIANFPPNEETWSLVVGIGRRWLFLENMVRGIVANDPLVIHEKLLVTFMRGIKEVVSRAEHKEHRQWFCEAVETCQSQGLLEEADKDDLIELDAGLQD